MRRVSLADLVRELFMKRPYSAISKVPGMTDCCNKDVFARIMNFWAKIFPSEYKFLP